MEETEKLLQQRRNTIRNKLIEISLWVFVGVIFVLPTVLTFSYKAFYFDPEYATGVYNRVLLALLFLFIPLLSHLIFGKLPIQVLRERQTGVNRLNPVDISGSGNVTLNVVKHHDIQTYVQEVEIIDTIDYALACIKESDLLCTRIFTRSGVYLMVGCMIAFIGVGIFYSPWFAIQKTPISSDLGQRMLDYLPRVSALFFIEFIAFFFLKQYRIMMDEYRYYEAVKRKRQDNYNLTNFIQKNQKEKEMVKSVLDHMSSAYVAKLASGETTEILESQKITNQDFDLIGKVTALVKELRANDK